MVFRRRLAPKDNSDDVALVPAASDSEFETLFGAKLQALKQQENLRMENDYSIIEQGLSDKLQPCLSRLAGFIAAENLDLNRRGIALYCKWLFSHVYHLLV